MNSATAIGVWRIAILAQAFLSKTVTEDATYSIGFCRSSIEVNVAVVTACGLSMKAITNRYLPRLLGTSRDETSGYRVGTSGSRKFPGSRIFSANKASQIQSHADDSYEMADPQGGHRVDINADREFDIRKCKRGGDSPNTTRGSEAGVVGIVKSTNDSVRYTSGEITPTHEDDRSRDGKHAGIDSLV
jgi:hypothetical protein